MAIPTIIEHTSPCLHYNIVTDPFSLSRSRNALNCLKVVSMFCIVCSSKSLTIKIINTHCISSTKLTATSS